MFRCPCCGRGIEGFMVVEAEECQVVRRKVVVRGGRLVPAGRRRVVRRRLRDVTYHCPHCGCMITDHPLLAQMILEGRDNREVYEASKKLWKGYYTVLAHS